MSLKDFILNKFVEKKMDGKTPVVIDNTIASINLIRNKIEKTLFIISLITTAIFFGFYGYMIYANVVSGGLVRMIVYIVLMAVLIVSTVFDIILYPGKRQKMNFLDKKKFSEARRLKRKTILIIKTIVKAISIGYALYEILAIDSSPSKVAIITLSAAAFLIQIIIYFISDLIILYANYLMTGINLDLEESGAYVLINKDAKDIIKANQMIRTKSDEQLIEEIKKQVFGYLEEILMSNDTFVVELQQNANISLEEVEKWLKSLDDNIEVYKWRPYISLADLFSSFGDKVILWLGRKDKVSTSSTIDFCLTMRSLKEKLSADDYHSLLEAIHLRFKEIPVDDGLPF